MPTAGATSPPTFHGLLYIDHADRPVNLSGRADPIDIYARCAATCARSVAAQGFSFRLITNDAGALARRYAAMGVPGPTVTEHRFGWDVPPIPFRSAHRKLELFDAFAGGAFGPLPVLIDIDTLLLRPFPVPLEAGALHGYDITAQVAPAYGADTLARDLAAIAGEPVAPRWWGGEFIAGDTRAFAALAEAVARCWPRYLAQVGSLHHLGDEAVTSAALGLLAREGAAVVDCGGAVQRWWSNRTVAPQAASLSDAMAAALLHLPADKPLLAGFADPDTAFGSFATIYRRYVRRRLPAHRLLAFAARLRGQPRRFAPRLR